MQTITATAAMTAWADATRASGQVIGLVPTMGFLHSGHTSLMDRLRNECDQLVVSIFVNPLQFGPNEDLDRYPRDPEGDAAKCQEHGVDVLFTPSDFYPAGFSTHVAVDGLTTGLCGAKRPGHFEGVTTVVARLFGVTRASVAVFGEKDFQQLMVIRRMVRDLALPVRIVPGPLVRDRDGLALSSRNVYLTALQRERGLSLRRALLAMQRAADEGENQAAALLQLGRRLVDADAIDYLELVDAQSLQPISVVERPARALVAGFYGTTRLIDNVRIGPELQW